MKDSDKKTADAAHIGGVLNELLKHFRPEAEQGMLRIWRVWDRAVGAEIARNARPAAVKGSILLVHVTSSTWLHHLQYRKGDLLARLNDALGQAAVSEIKFKIGSF
jgi:predicted nucleic acid-binding Zn ribbon protein